MVLRTLADFRSAARRLGRGLLTTTLAVGCGLTAMSARGDVIRMKDGSTLEGDIRRVTDGWEVTVEGGRKVFIPSSKVAGLEAKPKRPTAVSDERLASLRRAAEAMPDLKQVIDRYRSFITQFAGSPAAEAAKVDLATWQDRLDRKLVKVGDQWLTEVEREAVLEKSYETAEQALAQLQQGRTTQGTPLLEQALVENPKNAAALYMKGILLFKQDKAVEARKLFEAATAVVPDHAATYNNLAVVLWRQNQYVAALLNYEKALLASPLHRGVLDNMAEALSALPVELREVANVKRVVRHFNDQDALLQHQMVEDGMYRWGATWVSKADFDRLQGIEREIRGRIDQLEIEFNAINARVQRIDVDIQSIQNTVRQMEANTIGYDANGRLVRYPLPPSYYDFVRDLGTLKAERDQRMAEQEQMRQQARKLQQSIPTPKYTGAQRLIEWEGTPIFGKGNQATPLPPAATPATQPVAMPLPAGPGNPAQPGNAPQPSNTSQPSGGTPPAAPTTQPRRPAVPFEKPSIMDRRFSEDAPPPTAPSQPGR